MWSQRGSNPTYFSHGLIQPRPHSKQFACKTPIKFALSHAFLCRRMCSSTTHKMQNKPWAVGTRPTGRAYDAPQTTKSAEKGASPLFKTPPYWALSGRSLNIFHKAALTSLSSSSSSSSSSRASPRLERSRFHELPPIPSFSVLGKSPCSVESVVERMEVCV